MNVYSEVYLKEIVETQGKLFEKISEYYQRIDVADFIQAYMKSKTRKYIDQGQAYVCTMDASDLWDYFLKTDSYVPKKGNDIGGFIPNWIGQFYAYYQWYYAIPSEEVLRILPIDFMIGGYRGLHDLELELAVKKVGKQVGQKTEKR